MNNRERWVVYPLLIWSLALGFRSQYEYLFEREELQCRELHIIDDTGKTRILLKANAALGGAIFFAKSDETATVRLGEKGIVEIMKSEDPKTEEAKPTPEK